MNKPLSKNIVFRIIIPIVFGILSYLIVLMIFDSVWLISENFFSKEVAFFITMSFVVFESMLLLLGYIEKKAYLENSPGLKLVIFIVLSVVISISEVSLFVQAYFRFIEKTAVFNTELLVFNFIMLFACFLYLSIFYSISFMKKQSEKAIAIETLEKENLDRSLKLFQNKVRPEILYESLEILIQLIHKNEKTAEEFITQLSNYYRSIIEERHTETILLAQEIKAAENLISLLNHKYQGLILLNQKNKLTQAFQTIPGILQQLVFMAIQKNIISEYLPLNINLSIENEYLIMSYFCHKRLTNEINVAENLSALVNKYKIYSNRKIKEEKNDQLYQIQIPLLTMEKEEYL